MLILWSFEFRSYRINSKIQEHLIRSLFSIQINFKCWEDGFVDWSSLIALQYFVSPRLNTFAPWCIIISQFSSLLGKQSPSAALAPFMSLLAHSNLTNLGSLIFARLLNKCKSNRFSGGGGYSWEFLVRVCRPVLQILAPDFRPKNVIFHNRFQTRTLKSIPVFRPGV